MLRINEKVKCKGKRGMVKKKKKSKTSEKGISRWSKFIAAWFFLIVCWGLWRGPTTTSLRPTESVQPVEMSLQLVCVTFEVWGKVQRVSMRKFTKKKAEELGLSGFVQNTESGSVKGECCGSSEQVEMMKEWLEHEGSPKARIDKAEFSAHTTVTQDKFNGVFEIRKVKFANGKQWAN